MSTGVWIAIAAVVLALGFGLHRMRADGRLGRAGATAAEPVERVEPAEPAPVEPVSAWSVLTAAADDLGRDELGERATLVQFSSAFCAPCRTTRVVLSDVAAQVPGVRHVEVDAEAHLDAVRRLGVVRTPTTIVLDPAGHEVVRAAGAPRRDQVVAALGRLNPAL